MSSIVSPEQISSEALSDLPVHTGLRPYSQVFAAFLCGVVAFLDLYCTQPLLPLFSHVFHASEGRVSLTISASTLGVAFSSVMLAIFAERVDRKRTILYSMVALALSAMLTSTATTLPVLIFWRLVQGLLTPGVFIITIAYITEEWPPLLVPRVMSFYVAGTVFGGFLGRVAGGMVAERFGWRAVFLFLGVLGLVGAAITQGLLLPARKRSVTSASSSRMAPVMANLRNARLLATFVIGFCMLFTLVSVFSYITFHLAAPPFLLTTRQLSWLFTVYLCGLAATIAAGTVLARVGLRHGMIASTLIALAGTLLTLTPSLLGVGLGLALVGSGVFISQTCTNSFLRDAAPDGVRVAAAGMYTSSYYIGGTVGGILPGAIWRFGGWPACAALTCLVIAVSGLCAFFGWRVRPPAPDPIPL